MAARITRAVLAALFLSGWSFAAAAEQHKEQHNEQPSEQHGLSGFGDLRYRADFTHFAYVNPAAPKGGELSQIGVYARYNAGFRSFDSLNGYILKGQAAQGLHLLFDTLMARAWDEPDAVYGLAAAGVVLVPAEKGGVKARFRLRPQARFADGSRLGAEDAAFSLTLLQEQGHPLIAQPLKAMVHAKALEGNILEVLLAPDAPRSLLLLISQLPIFSRAYYTAHDFSRTSLEPPLGSGPYAVAHAVPGRMIRYQKRDAYWAKDLPVNRGKWNFASIRYEFFRDDTAAFEAFKTGQYRLREEFVSKIWATQYDFPALRQGEVKQVILPDGTPSGAQGWFFNMRRAKFAAPEVREALAMVFDFPFANRHLFHSLYTRTASFFENSPMKANGRPDKEETALLRAAPCCIPRASWGEVWQPPLADGSGQDRSLLRRAGKLLDEAGWRIRNGQRQNRQGEVLRLEFLLREAGFERIVALYAAGLKRLGVAVDIRLVDPAQYEERVKRFDYDIVTSRFTIANTPGPELRALFSSAAAAQPGSRNLAGLKNPAVDFLVERAIAAPARAEQYAALRALDRVLRPLHIWVPQWHKASHAIAYWQGYQRPGVKPRYHRGIEETWWAE